MSECDDCNKSGPFQNIGEVRLVLISVKMVSRRKILSRSRDDLNLDEDYKDITSHHQDDTWYSKEKLYKVGQYLERSLSHPTPTNHDDRQL